MRGPAKAMRRDGRGKHTERTPGNGDTETSVEVAARAWRSKNGRREMGLTCHGNLGLGENGKCVTCYGDLSLEEKGKGVKCYGDLGLGEKG